MNKKQLVHVISSVKIITQEFRLELLAGSSLASSIGMPGTKGNSKDTRSDVVSREMKRETKKRIEKRLDNNEKRMNKLENDVNKLLAKHSSENQNSK